MSHVAKSELSELAIEYADMDRIEPSLRLQRRENR